LVLLKKCNKPDGKLSSYRPICLLSEAGKLFERVLTERLRVCLHDADELSEEQFSFRKGRSTINAILRLKGLVEDATGEGRLALVIGLDIAIIMPSIPSLGQRSVMRSLRRESSTIYVGSCGTT